MNPDQEVTLGGWRHRWQITAQISEQLRNPAGHGVAVRQMVAKDWKRDSELRRLVKALHPRLRTNIPVLVDNKGSVITTFMVQDESVPAAKETKPEGRTESGKTPMMHTINPSEGNASMATLGAAQCFSAGVPPWLLCCGQRKVWRGGGRVIAATCTQLLLASAEGWFLMRDGCAAMCGTAPVQNTHMRLHQHKRELL